MDAERRSKSKEVQELLQSERQKMYQSLAIRNHQIAAPTLLLRPIAEGTTRGREQILLGCNPHLIGLTCVFRAQTLPPRPIRLAQATTLRPSTNEK
jgi:hypothetical protein